MKSYLYVVFMLLNGCLFFDSARLHSASEGSNNTSNNISSNNGTPSSNNNRSTTMSSNNPSVAGSNNGSSTNIGTSHNSTNGTSNTSNSGTTNSATLPSDIEPNVESGADFNCALKSDGSVNCWGVNNTIEFTTPLTRLSCGYAHCCGLTVAGDIVCSGKDNTAYFDSTNPPLPVDESRITGKTMGQSGPFMDVSAGGEHSCGLKQDGSMFCWGRPGDFGGDRTDVFMGTKNIKGSFVEISSGAFHVCAKTDEEKVVCFGGKEFGDQDHGQANPSILKLSGKPSSLHAGVHRTCAILDTGKVFCWGRESFDYPWPIGGGDPYRAIALGDNWGCGIKESGPTVCWGEGVPLFEDGPKMVPRPQPADRFSSLDAGTRHACGIREGTIQCWGAGEGATNP